MSWMEMSKANERGGVRTETVDENHGGQRIDNFLSARLKGVPRSLVYRLIRTGQVRINGKRCKPASRLSAGDLVRIPPARVSERGEAVISDRILDTVKSRILHADADMLVVDKPSGMAVHAGSGLPWGAIDVLRRLYPGEYLELAHRLDRETSGCLVLARNGKALQHISALFRDGRVDKRYFCLLDGTLAEELVEIDAPLARVHTGQERQVEVSPDGKPAQTRFRLIENCQGASYSEAELLTGRTHQIRVHALHMGLPLAGDRRYAPADSVKRWRQLGLRRIFLHAHSMVFENQAGDVMTFNAPLPEELYRVLAQLR